MTTDSDEPTIFTESVYDPPEAPYFRYLVARTWPSGVTRGHVDQWDREIAPSLELLEAWRTAEIDEPSFEARYEAELDAQPAMIDWAVRTASVSGIVLVDDAPAEPSPRSVLARIIRRRAEQDGTSA